MESSDMIPSIDGGPGGYCPRVLTVFIVRCQTTDNLFITQ